MVALALLAASCIFTIAVATSPGLPENNPDLGKYQNEETCFPLAETWYIFYRNFEDDPYFGGSATCVRATEASEFTGVSTTVTIQDAQNTPSDVQVTLASSPGYDVLNVIHVTSTQDNSISFNLTAAYADVQKCMVFRHSYIDGGKGCSYWLPESQLGISSTCCEFIFDLLCGNSTKYQIYKDCEAPA